MSWSRLEQVLSWSKCSVGASVELEQVLSWSRCRV